jgi:hypothetical protein
MTDDKLIDAESMTAVSWVKGKGWVATGCIPLEDAIRSYRDRPSVEAELTALRDKCQRYEAALKEEARAGWDGAIDTCAEKYGVTKDMFADWWDRRNALKGEGRNETKKA